MAALRQPILSLLGHVDHGKTSLLDRIAGSVRAEHEAGGITQHIGAIEVPKAAILELCEGVTRTEQFNVPGLLFVDTPGHRSFATLRRRGGALADLAILVIDSREGVMPQTRESIQILRHEKTPFAVALTKIDLLSGWRKPSGRIALKDQIERSAPDFGRLLDQKLYSVAEELNGVGFSSDRYDRVSDFTHNVGIVPVSSKSGVGVPELLALMVGLAQRFLPEELALVVEGGEATILERSDQKGVGPVTSIILYRGRLAVGDDLVVNGRSEPFRTRVRGIYRPSPTVKGHGGKGRKLTSVEKVEAAAGVYVSAPGIEKALPGGLVRVVRSETDAVEAIRALTQASRPVADLAESGIALCSDTLGGIEALAFECQEAKLAIHSVEVGPVNRSVVVRMATMRDPTHRAVLAFNVAVLPEAQPEGDASDVKIFRGEVMYRLLDDYRTWKTEREEQVAKQRRLDTVHPAKFEVLPGYIFRASKPAIVGIKVLGGTLRPGVRLMKVD
ncbi:MAG: translation initiation factor IF-2, partial [Thermoplasmata archaeon]|nr:translation initiation factor IF-2 [Thermoplasmata archaeon]